MNGILVNDLMTFHHPPDSWVWHGYGVLISISWGTTIT